MRSLIFLSLLSLSAAANLTGSCITSAEDKGMLAGNDLLDAAVYTFAAVERCKNEGEEVKCEVDVTDAMHSSLSLINNILALLNDCDFLHIYNKDCGLAASELIETVAGLASGVGRTIQHCPVTALPGTAVNAKDSTFPVENVAKCTVYVKDAVTSILKAIDAITKITACDADAEKCTGTKAQNAVLVAQVLAGLGSYLSGGLGYCSIVASDVLKKENPIVARDALCSEAVSDLVKFSAKLSYDGMDVSKKCSNSKPVRLYQGGQGIAFGASSSPNLLLMACVPVTAVLSFLGGRMVGKYRTAATRSVTIVDELE